MKKHVIAICVENQSGVLSRVSGLFSRRGFNIDSLSVGVTEDPRFSRITVVAFGDDKIIEQIQKQLEKLVDVRKVVELTLEDSLSRELTLVKVNANSEARAEILSVAEVFRANIIDVSHSTLTTAMIGTQSKIDAFIQLLTPYGILEIVRTGLTGIQRGENTLTEKSIIDNEGNF